MAVVLKKVLKLQQHDSMKIFEFMQDTHNVSGMNLLLYHNTAFSFSPIKIRLEAYACNN